MAATERILILKAPSKDPTRSDADQTRAPKIHGLKISIRTTTSSYAGYPEWNLEEARKRGSEGLVTDGSCS